MKRLRVVCTLSLLAGALAGPACGQSPGRSPYQCRWSKDSWIIGACALGGAGAVIVEHSIEPITLGEINRLSRAEVNRFDRNATYNYSDQISDVSYALAGAVVAAPLALLLDHDVIDSWRTYSLMYMETVALAVIIPAFAKRTVERVRPFVYNPDVPMDRRMTDDPRGSFFSRHTTMAFASAVFLSTAHDAYHPGSASSPYIWAGSLLAATAVGVMRIESGEHFPTDVIAGAAVGSAIGYLIPRMHRVETGRFSLTPVLRGSEVGLALKLKM
jgi:hypothetical protein